MELILGIALLVICIIFLINSGIIGILPVGFVMIIAISLIIRGLKKKKKDSKTDKLGETCFGKVIECTKTGNFALDKEEYLVTVSFYSESLKKKLIMDEVTKYVSYNEYPKDTYVKVIYYNSDINIKEKINENIIPNDILKIINNNEGIEEYKKKKEEEKEKELEKQNEIKRKVENVMPIIEKVGKIYTTIACFLFSILVIFFASYITNMINSFKNFNNNMIQPIIMVLILIINLGTIIPLNYSPFNSKKRLLFGILWFISTACIMISVVFIN